MSDNVVSFLKGSPHLEGPARCIDCHHKWETEAPIGTVGLLCPACGAAKGGRFAMIVRDGDHLHCRCKNPLFLINDKEIYCPNCGLTQAAEVVFE